MQLKRFRNATHLLTLDPLVFWADKTVMKRYPTLASLALQVFATQASSVASERAFSAVGDVLTNEEAKRHGLLHCVFLCGSLDE